MAPDGVTIKQYLITCLKGDAQKETYDDDDEEEPEKSPSGAVRLVSLPGTDKCGAEVWSGTFWEPLMSEDSVQEGLIQIGKWSHLALVLSETRPKKLTFYVDGEKQLTLPQIGFDFSDWNLGLGALLPGEANSGGLTSQAKNGETWKSPPGQAFCGRVCQVEFWQALLMNDDQISELTLERDAPVKIEKDPLALAAAEASKVQAKLAMMQERAEAAEARVKKLEPVLISGPGSKAINKIGSKFEENILRDRDSLQTLLEDDELDLDRSTQSALLDKILLWKYGM